MMRKRPSMLLSITRIAVVSPRLLPFCWRMESGLTRVAVPPTVAVAPGDLLLTGATLGLFPDGIPVGRVERVERAQGGLKVRAWARPLVDLSLLEEVVVLRPL